MNIWRALPAYISNFLGHSATHSIWEAHLSRAPVHTMQPHWQVLEKGEDDKSTVWGLQSITLHTVFSEAGSPWPGEWPPCLPAGDAKLANANECFGEPLIHAQGIALYQIKSPLGEDWVVQCAFTEEGHLQYLTFVKMHEWKPLNGENPQVVDTQLSPKLSEIGLSAAGTLAPANGWYEALLPAGHPMQPYYAKSEVRLVYREQGELFPKLGVMPVEDEASVQWAWVRES